MFKKAKKFIKKDLQRRYEKLEDRFLKFETRLYGRLEERMARLEAQLDELSIYVRDRVHEEEPATEEEVVTTASKDKADDLKVLKGLGKSMEAKLQQAGIYSFEQLASLSDADIQALNEQIPGFQQRFERNDWRGQAKSEQEK